MGIVWEIARSEVKSKELASLLLDFDNVLGLDLKNHRKKESKIPEEDLKLVEERNIARKNKNWEESDRIRDILMSKGYTVKDGKEGTLIEK